MVALEQAAQPLALGAKKATWITAFVSDWSSARVK